MLKMRHFKKIGDYHSMANLPSPEHPLISLVDYSKIQYPDDVEALNWRQDYYTIGLKRNIPYKFYYGQQKYDFDEGVMTFIAPNQVMSLESNPNIKSEAFGWLLLVHPDFLWNSPLSKMADKYAYFGYTVSEALFLSGKEETMMSDILRNIQNEYQSNIDKFSQKIIVSQLELLLNYAERFYERQFITRKISNHKILDQLELILSEYFSADILPEKGFPSVSMVAQRLNLSSNYLSNMLKSLTGQSTQQHIHNKIIVVAKEQLINTQHSVSEIAYNLGFEYPASFNKLFKNKTEMSPSEFRKSFN